MRDPDKMAVDDEEMDDDSEDVPETKITLVREADLESAISFSLPRVFVHNHFPFPPGP